MSNRMQVIFAEIEEINHEIAMLWKMKADTFEVMNEMIRQTKQRIIPLEVAVELIDEEIQELETKHKTLSDEFMKLVNNKKQFKHI